MLFKIISLSFWNYNINESFSLHFLSSNPATHPCLFKFMSFFSVIVIYTHTHTYSYTPTESLRITTCSVYITLPVSLFSGLFIGIEQVSILLTGEGYFSFSQYYCVACSSLWMVEASWAFFHPCLHVYCHPCSVHIQSSSWYFINIAFDIPRTLQKITRNQKCSCRTQSKDEL